MPPHQASILHEDGRDETRESKRKREGGHNFTLVYNSSEVRERGRKENKRKSIFSSSLFSLTHSPCGIIINIIVSMVVVVSEVDGMDGGVFSKNGIYII